MMYILDGDAVTHMIVPNGKHATQNGRMLLIEHHLSYMGRRPLVVQIFVIQIVMIITRHRDNIDQTVGDADQFVTLLHHSFGFGIAIIPGTHDDILRLDRSITCCMGQRSPHTSLLAITLDQPDIAVGKGTELLDYIFLLVGIFVSADVHTRSPEDRFVTLQILLEKSIHECIRFGVEQIQMVHAVLAAAYFGLVMSECQRMGRSIYFGNDFDKTTGSFFLKVDELAFRIVAVACRQPRISITLQTESSIGTTPVVTEELLEAIVVEVYLKSVHLVVSHHLDQVAKVGHGDELAAAIHHKATQGIVGIVAYLSLWQTTVSVLLAHLKQRTRSPVNTGHFGSRNGNSTIHTDGIAFGSQFLVFLQGQKDVTGARLSLLHPKNSAEHLSVIGSKCLGYRPQGRLSTYNTHVGRRLEHAICSLPLFQFGNDKRFFVKGIHAQLHTKKKNQAQGAGS